VAGFSRGGFVGGECGEEVIVRKSHIQRQAKKTCGS